MRKALGIGLVAVVAALVAWRLLDAEGGAPGSSGASGDVGRGASAPSATAPEGVRRAGGSDAASRASVPSAPFQDAALPVETFVVRVVDPSGAPAVGALVTWPSSGAVAASSATTDVEGRAAVPRFAEVAAVFARKGSALGYATWDPKALVDVLEIALKKGTEVVVVASDGKPAGGVPVGVANVDPSWLTTVAVETTDVDGRAVFALDRYVTNDARGFVLRALVPGLPPGVGEAIPPAPSEAATAPPLRIELPPTGSLTVRLVAQDGKTPYAAPAKVVVFDVAGDRRAVEGATDSSDVASVRRTTDGVAAYPRVAVGAALKISVDPEAAGERTVVVDAETPAAAGLEATTTVVVGGPCVTVVGRLVDAAGAPRAGATLYVQPKSPADAAKVGMWASHGVTAQSGTDGVFRAAFDVDPPAFAARETRILVQNDGSDPGSVVGREGETLVVKHGGPDRAHEVLLGDVALSAQPTLASGRVVDDQGAPVPSATVSLFVPEGVVVGTDGVASPPTRYRRDWEANALRTRTDKEGRFVLRGKAPTSPMARFVGAECDGFYLLRPAPYPTTGEVKVELARGGGIYGSLKIPEGAVSAGRGRETPFEVWIGGPPARGDGLWSYRAEEDLAQLPLFGAEFRSRSLAPGVGRIVFKAEGRPEPLLVVDDVVVSAGETNSDPRLQDVDLSRFLAAKRVRILDEDGKPLAGALAHARLPSSWRWQSAGCDASGTASVATFGAPTQVVATAPGRLGADLGEIAADVEVRLKRATPVRVRFRLDASVDLPETPYSLAVRPSWIGPEGTAAEKDSDHGHPFNVDSDESGGTFGKDRVVVASLLQPGVYAADVWFSQDDGNTKSATSVGGGGARFLVRPGDKEIAVDVGVDGARLKELLKRGVR